MPKLYRPALLLLLAAFVVPAARSQSSDPRQPTPITSERLAGRIEPRDVGDARTTTHYYTFEALPGDLEFEVTSENLNGDADLFVEEGLRPLTKITLLASPVPARVSRTIFLREPATLVLRVVARSPGDEAGTYAVNFGGTFRASSRTPLSDAVPADAASSEARPETQGAQGGSARRVSATGARLEEPPREEAAEVARVPALPEKPPSDTEGIAPAPVIARRRARNPNAARRGTARPPRPPRATRSAPAPPTNDPAIVAETDGADAPGVRSERAPSSAPPSAPANAAPTRARKPARARRSAAATRLVIRTREGERIERSMSDVERVTIEGGELVVLLKSGEERRLSLADVARFAIEP